MAQKTTEPIQTEELLQAVVLADSFDTKFAPITLEMPRVSTQQTWQFTKCWLRFRFFSFCP